MTVYVYGVMPSSGSPSVSSRGVEDGEVRRLEHAGLAALVSDLRGDALAAAREVRAHWRVLDEASEKETVLPVRFGTVMEDEDDVRTRLLEPNAERLEHLLRELAGRVQLAVKGDYREQPLMRDIVRESRPVAELRERVRSLPGDAAYYQRIRLGELVAGEVERFRAEDTRVAIDTLEPLASACTQEQLTHADAAFNIAFLVDRERQQEFGRGVRELANKLGERVDLRFIGPLPPYSFADVELDPEAAAWA